MGKMDYHNQFYFSVFAGVCKSEKLLGQYLKQYWERVDIGLESSQFGLDFGIDYYDDEYFISRVALHLSDKIDEVFADAAVFDLNLLKEDYPDHLEKPFNTVLIFGRLKYEGVIREVQNDKYGYFQFLGTYPEALSDKIDDDPEMDNYALNQLADWGYQISVSNEKRDDSENHIVWGAKKDGKTFTARDPLRLLGIVTIVREYGDAWDRVDVTNVFSIHPEREKPVLL